MGISMVPITPMLRRDEQTTDEKIPKRRKEAKKLSKDIKRKAKIRKTDATTADEGGGGGGGSTRAGGHKISRGSMKKGLKKVSKFKKGGQITYRMTGGQVVDHGYD
jgi:hypothetical protein